MNDKKAEALERIGKGESPTEIAKAIGVSKVTIHSWKKEGALPAAGAPRDLEIELLKLDVAYWKGRAELLQRALNAAGG